MSEFVPVETVKPGDEIRVLRTFVVVANVHTYDDGAIVVTYFKHDETSFENRARDKSGPNVKRRLVEQGLVPKRAGDIVEIERGAKITATRLHKALRQQTAEAMARSESRQRARA